MSLAAYCNLTSVYAGDSISLHGSASPPSTVAVAVSRFGVDGELLRAEAECGAYQTPDDADAKGCRWPAFISLAIPDDWPSGVYVAQLTRVDDPSDTRDLHFVVKARVPSAPAVLSIPVATYAAYNFWPKEEIFSPGGNLYLSDAPDRSRQVSLLRPETWQFLYRREHLWLEWVRRAGISIDYCTSIDLHNDAEFLSKYSLLVSVGHDEYWSKEMRDTVEGFVTGGGNAAFFSGNTAQWQIRLEDDDTTIVCYKNALEDPLRGIDDERLTIEWYLPPVERPTNSLTGVSFRYGAGFGWGSDIRSSREEMAYRVHVPKHWVFRGVELAPDQTFGRGENIVGYETDAVDLVMEDGVPRATGAGGTPESFVILASADLRAWRGSGQGGYATMGVFRRNGIVFTAATVDWANGFEAPGSAVPTITRNVLDHLGRRRSRREWEYVGDAPELVSLTTFERRLYGLGADGTLWSRPPVAQNVSWTDEGRADDLVGMGATEQSSGRLIGAGATGFSSRVVGPGAAWEPLPGGKVPGAVDIAGANESIFALGDGRLWTRPSALQEHEWTCIDDAAGLTSLESSWNILLALTDGRMIVWRPTARDCSSPWQEFDCAPPSTRAIGVVDGRVVAVTDEGELWWRIL